MATAAGFGATGQLGKTYRDADGRVHYEDGSVGPAVAGWSDNGNFTYAKNADVQGDIYREQGMAPPSQTSNTPTTNLKAPVVDGGGSGSNDSTLVSNSKTPYLVPNQNSGAVGGALSNAANSGLTGAGANVGSASGSLTSGSTGINTGASAAPGIIQSAITPWNVTSDQTVAGNIQSLTSNESPLMQQARTRAAQQMSSRGLINSSLAATAADSAVYDVANTIAQSDAATKAKAAGYNVDQLNQQVTLDKQLANQMSQAQLSADTARYSTDVNASTSKYNTDTNAAIQKLNNESAQTIAKLNNEQQITLQKMQNENSKLLNTNQQAAQAYNNSMQYIDVINRDPNLDADAKTRAQAQIYYNLQTQLRTLAAVSGIDVTQSLSLANAPGFDDKGNYVGFKDATGTTTKPPTTSSTDGQTNSGGGD